MPTMQKSTSAVSTCFDRTKLTHIGYTSKGMIGGCPSVLERKPDMRSDLYVSTRKTLFSLQFLLELGFDVRANGALVSILDKQRLWILRDIEAPKRLFRLTLRTSRILKSNGRKPRPESCLPPHYSTGGGEKFWVESAERQSSTGRMCRRKITSLCSWKQPDFLAMPFGHGQCNAKREISSQHCTWEWKTWMKAWSFMS